MFPGSQRVLQSTDVDTGSTVSVGKCTIHCVLGDGSCIQHPALPNNSGLKREQSIHWTPTGHRDVWESEIGGGEKRETATAGACGRGSAGALRAAVRAGKGTGLPGEITPPHCTWGYLEVGGGIRVPECAQQVKTEQS